MTAELDDGGAPLLYYKSRRISILTVFEKEKLQGRKGKLQSHMSR